MAGSNITKRALADAIKALMEEGPFEKISIAQICDKCGMNRKSFYYHFRDKYDLLNWIFDTDFISFAKSYAEKENISERLDVLNDICAFFYKNRSFYRKALKIEDCNSLSEHMQDYFRPLIAIRIKHFLGEEATDDFAVDFYSDAALGAFRRWILDENSLPPEEFSAKLIHLLVISADALHAEMESIRS